jgi:periplasmic protein TonB
MCADRVAKRKFEFQKVTRVVKLSNMVCNDLTSRRRTSAQETSMQYKHGLAAISAALLAACSSTPPPAPVAPVAHVPATVPDQPVAVVAPPVVNHHLSQAADPRAYRRDAAAHLYAQNKDRIYKGKMPPLLHAVAVLQVELDAQGNVRSLNWMRAPSHAPEVVAEIERTVRAASPFPAPARMGRVVYTDTWLWHKSGRFQLDTLTEGQL